MLLSLSGGAAWGKTSDLLLDETGILYQLLKHYIAKIETPSRSKILDGSQLRKLAPHDRL